MTGVILLALLAFSVDPSIAAYPPGPPSPPPPPSPPLLPPSPPPAPPLPPAAFTCPIREGIVTTVVGTGSSGYSGDGGPALNASFNGIAGFAFNPTTGDLAIADQNNNRIRAVSATDGIVSTLIGNGVASSIDGFFSSATVNQSTGVVYDPEGNLYFCEYGGKVRVLKTNGIVSTLATVNIMGPFSSCSGSSHSYSCDPGSYLSSVAYFNGSLYATTAWVSTDPYSASQAQISTNMINISTGTVQSLFQFSNGNGNRQCGWAFDLSGNMYGHDPNDHVMSGGGTTYYYNHFLVKFQSVIQVYVSYNFNTLLTTLHTEPLPQTIPTSKRSRPMSRQALLRILASLLQMCSLARLDLGIMECIVTSPSTSLLTTPMPRSLPLPIKLFLLDAPAYPPIVLQLAYHPLVLA